MSNRHTYDHLQKKSKWEEQEQMAEHYGPVSFPVSAENAHEPDADAMAARLTMSAAELKYGQAFATVNKLKNGSAIPWLVRKKMEWLFKASFSNVRVFTGDTAAVQNARQSSLAYTFGESIYFKQGQYNPYTLEGQKLLVHELMHVVQQRSGKKTVMMKPDGPPLTSPIFAQNADFIAISNGTLFLKKGMKRPAAITVLQQVLDGLGYITGSDKKGVFGDNTESAVKQFQAANGIKADGIVGSDTVRSLDIYYGTGDRERISNASNLNSYGFKIPVLLSDLMEGSGVNAKRKTADKESADMLLKAMSYVFKIERSQAVALVEAGWHWTHEYTPVSDSDLTKIKASIPVFKNVTVSKEDYEKIMGKQGDGPGSEFGVNTGGSQPGGKAGAQSMQEQEEDAYSALQHDLDRLFKVSPELYASYKADSAAPKVLDGLIEAGFATVDDFEKTVEGFKKHFELYAVLQVFYVLESSRKETTIEQKRYGGSKDNGVQSLMNRLKEGLEQKYNAVDTKLLHAIELYKQRIIQAKFARQAELDATEYELPDYGSIKLSEINAVTLKSFTHKDIREVYVIAGFHFSNAIINTGGYTGEGNKKISINEAEHYVGGQPGVKEMTELFREEDAFQIDFVNKNAHDYPIIADPSVFEKLRLHTRTTSVGKLKTTLAEASSTVLESIAAMQEEFRDPDNYEKVWELSPILLLTQNKLHIINASTPELIIKDKLEEVKTTEMWKSLGLAALGIGLAIASIFTAGATAALLVGLGAGVSAVDLYREYGKYSFQKSAHNTNFDRNKALSETDPSIIWVVIAAVGFGLDFLSVLKALKGLKAAASLKQTVEESAEAMRIAARQNALTVWRA